MSWSALKSVLMLVQEIQIFTQHKMLAYRNGKSAGRVVDADWHGPHRFTGAYHVVPVSKACVLHFESCLYEQWRNKFIKHRTIDEKKKQDIPFPFYRDSISLFQVIIERVSESSVRTNMHACRQLNRCIEISCICMWCFVHTHAVLSPPIHSTTQMGA